MPKDKTHDTRSFRKQLADDPEVAMMKLKMMKMKAGNFLNFIIPPLSYHLHHLDVKDMNEVFDKLKELTNESIARVAASKGTINGECDLCGIKTPIPEDEIGEIVICADCTVIGAKVDRDGTKGKS